MKNKFLSALSVLLCGGMILPFATSCGFGSQSSSSDEEQSMHSASGALDAEDSKTEISGDFSITPTDSTSSEDETESSSSDEPTDGDNEGDEGVEVVKITEPGEYSLKNVLNGYVLVDVPDNGDGETDTVTLNLEGCEINSSTQSPIYIKNAEDVEISAKKGTYNEINDLRPLKDGDDETQGGGAIFADCDLKIKGAGNLVVNASYNNGIHSKDDLKIQKATVKVTAPNNAIKGNDSVSIAVKDGAAANVIAISTAGDGIKADNSSLSSKGKQKGTVTIDGCNVDIYCAGDGIDAAYDAVITESSKVNIFTDSYSQYTNKTDKVITKLGLRVSASTKPSYRLAGYFYDDAGNYKWVNAVFDKEESATTSTGGFGGSRPGSTARNYYYYTLEIPKGYKNIAVYTFNASAENSTESFLAKSKGETINSAMDLYALTISSSSIMGSWGNLAGSSKGIKADNEVAISGGIVNISATDDGIHANGDVTLETGVIGKGNVSISGGEITVISKDDGVHADAALTISAGKIDVLTSYEGLEANQITISGGDVKVYATDDGVNAAKKLDGAPTPAIVVSGGKLDVTVGTGDTDGIDSNGTYTQTGGFVISKNTGTGMSTAIDTDGATKITGGTFVAVGVVERTPIDSQHYLSFGSATYPAGDYSVKDTDISFTLTATYRSITIYSDLFTAGVSYSLTGALAKTVTAK